MKVALVAFSGKGAMGQYAAGLATALAGLARVTLFAPNHFRADTLGAAVARRFFASGRTKARALVRFLNPVAGRALAGEIAADPMWCTS